MLADEVYESAIEAIKDFNGSGISILSISHRTKDFDAVMEEADSLFRELLHIPDNYKIFYVGGGASTLFYEVPANFLGKKAAYVNTGVWSKKAIKEAKRYGEVEVIATSEDKNFNYIPSFEIPSDVDYLHITSNNTIYGTEYHVDLDSPVPVIADMSSNILSRPIDVSKYAMIYGGAQKNLAPAGVSFVIIREDMLDKIVRDLPTMVSFKTHVENNSMFNTPPVFPIFVMNETLKWIKSIGGVEQMYKINLEKAQLLYDEIERNSLFNTPPVFPIYVLKESLMGLKSIGGVEEIYRRNVEKAELLYAEIDRNPLLKGTVEKDSRALMNICFVMAEGYEELAPEFMEYT